MIVTCTLNPSLDYYMESKEPIIPGTTMRSDLEYYEAGGKGINVSIVLNNLQVPTRATGFVGGFTKDFYIKLLEKYSYIQPNFTYIEGHTRVNVKFQDGNMETELNATGPYVTNNDMENLMLKTNRLDEGDYFVLGGGCQPYLKEYISAMLERLMNDGVRVCLDTNRWVLDDVQQYHPFLVKTRDIYESQYCGKELSRDELINKLIEIHENGSRNVICTMNGGREALFVNDTGIYFSEMTTNEHAVSMIGTGDALVGGFLMSSLGSTDQVDAFRFGSCCSEATAYSKGFATREKVLSQYEKSEVTKLK